MKFNILFSAVLALICLAFKVIYSMFSALRVNVDILCKVYGLYLKSTGNSFLIISLYFLVKYSFSLLAYTSEAI